MKMWKRIMLSALAWIVTHFVGYFILAIIYNENVPVGFLALIDMCVAFTVFYLTKEKISKTN